VPRERVREEATRLVAGEITEREFVSWVHTHVGHMGYDDLIELVELDGEYDPVDFPDEDRWFRESSEAAAIRNRVRELALRLLADD
jgi:hypothetical protein